MVFGGRNDAQLVPTPPNSDSLSSAREASSVDGANAVGLMAARPLEESNHSAGLCSEEAFPRCGKDKLRVALFFEFVAQLIRSLTASLAKILPARWMVAVLATGVVVLRLAFM